MKLKLQHFGHLMQRADSLEKSKMIGKNWRQEEEGMTEDEMVGWHHQLNGHEFEQTLGDGEEQGSLHAAVHGAANSWIRLSNWTATEPILPQSIAAVFTLLQIKCFSPYWRIFWSFKIKKYLIIVLSKSRNVQGVKFKISGSEIHIWTLSNLTQIYRVARFRK